MNLREPAWVERVPVRVAGQPSTRLIVILRASGCAWARTSGGGCTNCGFYKASTQGEPVADEDLVAQFEAAVGAPGALDGVGEVDVFNSGSFFADQEITPAVRAHVFGRLGRTRVRRVLVESRPEFVGREKLAAARELLPSQELEVGIGLESASDHVRDHLVHKGFGRAEFEQAVEALGVAGVRLLSYVLLKPLGLSEREAIEDAVASARYVFEVARRSGVLARVALEPVFVAPGTELEKAFLAERYTPPGLWSVVEVVRRVHPLGEVIVGLSDEGLEARRKPAGCERCTAPLRAALADYNRTRDLGALERVACTCAKPGA